MRVDTIVTVASWKSVVLVVTIGAVVIERRVESAGATPLLLEDVDEVLGVAARNELGGNGAFDLVIDDVVEDVLLVEVDEDVVALGFWITVTETVVSLAGWFPGGAVTV